MSYRLGLPAWAFKGWANRYFSDSPSMLASYAEVFNAVEANTTFYQVPDKNKIQQWYEAVRGQDFRFCPKLPQSVTHQTDINWADLNEFLANIAGLKEALGPVLVLFPAHIGPGQISKIYQVFSGLSADYRYALEVRNMAFFQDPSLLEPLIQQYNLAKVVLDSRPLYKGDQSHPEVVNAQHEKPNVPVSPAVRNQLAFVRLVLHPQNLTNDEFIQQWGKMFKRYQDHNIDAYMTIHCPNVQHCPEYALAFHRALAQFAPNLPSLNPWPVPQQGSFL